MNGDPPSRTELQPPGEPVDPRVYLAAERTLLAWIRTALAMMGFGFVVARFGLFLRELAQAEAGRETAVHGVSLWVGSGLVLLGVATNILAAAGHARFLRKLGLEQASNETRGQTGVIVAILLAIVGLAMAAYLLVFNS